MELTVDEHGRESGLCGDTQRHVRGQGSAESASRRAEYSLNVAKRLWISLQGISIHRPIIYGNSAVLLSEEERERAPKDHTHRWTVAVRSPAPGKDLDVVGGGDYLGYFIKRVTFKLHDTYTTPSRSKSCLEPLGIPLMSH